ncbi:hypothetical protein COL30_01930 [Bacillus pseudomycoides]|uniref:Uncharacterized protein n=1 Tax=Bacillus pseudomycoides TaxID=64104 RepID=A0A2C3W321_9BACI|nr:hypothetical protein CON79_16795 [Bacillus pseudomycoides]PEA80645.1 hypothetical protein CON99_27130 [Bacillus pseudomycoides]PED05568.1 hypothetical protein COO19_25545 [Bacillus pseudomycoides]PED69366.1 hypothetical protein CON97_25575 [Bacillus pseudomycoides]PEI46201.1 hypothetical protein CN620_01815 [Bacillus pseudomycoides]
MKCFSNKYRMNLYSYNKKHAILFIEVYRKDGVFINLLNSDKLQLFSKELEQHMSPYKGE